MGGALEVQQKCLHSKVQQNPRLQFRGRRGAAMGYWLWAMGDFVAKIQRMSIVQDDTKSGCNLLRSTLEKSVELARQIGFIRFLRSKEILSVNMYIVPK